MGFDNLLKLATIYAESSNRNDYMREYMKRRYHDKRQKLISALGNKCKKCSSKKGPFQIDHVDAKKKTMRAADVHSISDKKVKEEMKNLQLLCQKCHKNKTHDSWDYSTPKPRHGTYWMARKYKCQCPECKEAFKEKQKQWRKSKK